ncbi:MAG: hypothetical protein LBG27_11705 [Spirochaetaceae bacterium]|jgi:hypothetical protein|nr:hypothetical protein [Spirochaetaceae bacterium]
MRKIVLWGVVVAVAAGLTGESCAAGKRGLEDAPIITSATYQHTQYNGRNQPVEVKAAKEDAAPFVVTYFRSEEDLERGLNGGPEPPAEVGDYYVRVERPEGNGYRQGNPIKIEYHIQKAFITIAAEPVQRFPCDGKIKEIKAAAEPPVDPPLVFSYFAQGDTAALSSSPAKKGIYRVTVAFPGNERYMGASRDIELWIE